MSRFRGSIFKKSRKLGISLLENNKEFTKWKKRTYPPGQHGQVVRRRRTSLYHEQLKEKQKISLIYGLTDTQLRRFFKAACKLEGSLSFNLLLLLERRLDNMVYRMNFAPSRASARQLVNHGHILVNGRKVDIPSYWVSVNDVISVKERSKNMLLVNHQKDQMTVEFVEVDSEKKTGKFIRNPERSELNPNINEVYVVEWYKRLV